MKELFCQKTSSYPTGTGRGRRVSHYTSLSRRQISQSTSSSRRRGSSDLNRRSLFKSIKKTLLFFGALFFTVTCFAQPVVNLYNWSGYIPQKVLNLFQKQTGIHVNLTTFTDNEDLYEKLKVDPNAGYDVVVPSSYFVERMAQEGMLHRLDLSKLPNIKNLNPHLLNRAYDPGNHYSLPYLWGTTGILVNKKYYSPASVSNWTDLWDKRFANRLLIMNDMRDVFAMAMMTLGYSINTTDPAKIKQAYLKLRALMPNVKLFAYDGVPPIYIDEDALIGMAQSGDAEQVMHANKNYQFIYPKDGIIIWTDCLTIPKYAPHLANAYKLINFLLKPKIAKMIAMTLDYSSPNLAAIKLMPASVRNNPAIYPSQKALKNSQIEAFLGVKTLGVYMHYWNLLKLSP